MSTSFDGVEITTGTNANKEQSSPLLSIIWLHGLGADGHDFAAVVPELEKLGVHRCRFIFPHAPIKAVTINGGMEMRSWYDITSLDFESVSRMPPVFTLLLHWWKISYNAKLIVESPPSE